jgi:hypothetical protein
VLNANANPAQASDMRCAAVLGSKVLLALVGIALAAMVLVVLWSAS